MRQFTRRPLARAYACLLVLLAGVTSPLRAATLDLRPDEVVWLQQHRVITFCYSPDFPPYFYLDREQQPIGFIPDLFRLMGKRLGVTFRFDVDSWARAIEKSRGGECAGLASVRALDKWKSDFLFSRTILSNSLYIYSQNEQPTQPTNFAQLDGLRVAYIRNEALAEEALKRNPAIRTQAVDNVGELAATLAAKRADAAITGPGLEFWRRQHGNNRFEVSGLILESETPSVVAIRKDWPQLVVLLDKALADIAEAERNTLHDLWFGDIDRAIALGHLALNSEEMAWLARGHTVRVQAFEFPPYQTLAPQPAGVSIDTLRAIARRIGIRMEFVTDAGNLDEAVADVAGPRRRFDLLPLLNRMPDYERRLALTTDYAVSPTVIVARRESPAMTGLASLGGKRVSVVADHSTSEVLKREYPAIHVLEVATVPEALRNVATGLADAHVGNLSVAAYHIREHHFDNLIVVAPSELESFHATMAVRHDWPELASLLNKGLATLPAEDKAAIAARWASIEYRTPIDRMAIAWTVAVSLLFLLVALYWIRHLRIKQQTTQRHLASSRESEKQLAKLKEEADSANAAKSRFLAAASHDLRQPMQAISLFVDALSRTQLSEEQKNIFRFLRQSTQSLGDLLNVLLDISKLDSGVIKPEFSTVSVDTLFGRIEAEFAVLATEKSLRFKLCFPTDRMVLFTDAKMLINLLRNLIGNAIKYTSRGGILVGVRRRGDRALIQVWDTGIGIAPEQIDSIFEEYFQINNDARDRNKGLGIGLSIARRIATLLGSEINCRSRPGKGSRFELLLPLAERSAAKDSRQIDLSASEDEAAASHAGRHVVVIDDDAMVGV